MIGPSGAVRVMLATRPLDFRKGMDGLAMLVREQLGADPFCGAVLAFRSKRADQLRLLFFDGTGVVNHYPQNLCRWKRVEKRCDRERSGARGLGALDGEATR